MQTSANVNVIKHTLSKEPKSTYEQIQI